MKPKSLIQILLILLLPVSKVFSQSLNLDKIISIKNCTVKVTVEGIGSGTGFIIDNKGTVITCWHVIKPCLIINNNSLAGTRKIVVEFYHGQKMEYGIPSVILNKPETGKIVQSFDICAIIPVTPILAPTEFLKLGSFLNLKEGDEVVTCGYPFGIPRSFVSRGIVSTKYQDTSTTVINGIIEKKPVNLALIDITMNKGNSGGVIIKIGNDTIPDEVVGLADFIITPVGKDITDLLEDLQKSNSSGMSVSIAGVNPNESMAKITQVLTNLSDGISGCISIEYWQTLVDSLK